MSKQTGILNELVVGWFGIEPIILGCVAAKQHFILRSRHGASKTMFAKLVASAIGGNYRHYDATKDDMVSVAGIPNPEALKNGVLAFAKHDRSIWEADYISIDELSRAPRESQNMWLEILEERTCFGFPLKYQMAIATMNPETYNATYRVDEALLDRFTAVVEVPDVLNSNDSKSNKDVKDIIRQIVGLNMAGRRNERDPQKIQELKQAINAIESYYNDFIAGETTIQAVQEYVSNFGYELQASMKKDAEVYISPRRYILLANCIIACAAYYKYAQSVGLLTTKEGFFVDGAEIATLYVFATALTLDPKTVNACHQKARHILKNLIGSESDKLRYDIQGAKNNEAKIRLLKKNMSLIAKWTPAEITSILQSVSNSIVEALCNESTNEVFVAATAVDSLRDFFKEQTNHSSSMFRVIIDNVNSNLTCNIISFINELAQKQFAAMDTKQHSVCTYSRIQNSQSASPVFQKLWQGNLVNDSVKATIQAIFNNSAT